MHRARRFRAAGPAVRIAGLALLAGLTLAGCHTASSASPAPGSSSPGAASASPSLSVPGTHKSTTAYQISSPVSTIVVTSHVGDITVTGGSGPGTSVTQQVAYSKTPPVTTRTLSGRTLTISYDCPAQLVCGVAYVLQVPRGVAVQASAGAGSIRLSGLAGDITAKTDVGLINAVSLTGASVSLTTGAGAITAAFAATPHAIQAMARVGAITLRVPGGVSYQVTAHAHLGKATVSVPQSLSSSRTITASADVGAISITSAR